MIRILYLLYDNFLDIGYYLKQDENLSVKLFSGEYSRIDLEEVKKYYHENKNEIDIVICCAAKANQGLVWAMELKHDEHKKIILIDNRDGIYVHVIEPSLKPSRQNLKEITNLITKIYQS